MKNHFFYLSEFENTHSDCIRIYKELKHVTDEINTIVEPYGDSCSMSFYIWSKHKDQNYKFVLNEANPFLKELYEIIKDGDALELFNNTIREQRKYIFDNTADKKECKRRYYEYVKENSVYAWFFANKYFNIWPGVFPETTNEAMEETEFNLKTSPVYDFFSNANIEFLATSGFSIYKQYKTRENTLIILNIPRTFQHDPIRDIYKHLYNNDINNENAYIMAINENTWYIKLMFQQYMTIKECKKKYNPFENKTWYLIMNNFYA
jgi:hypothetical protein